MGRLLDHTVTAFTVLLAITAVVLLVYQPLLIGNVSGNSMEPTLSDGDKFVYTPIIEPQNNDIIVFEYARSDIQNSTESQGEETVLVVHRIIEVENSGDYVTQGDNNRKADGVIPESDVQGVAVLQYDESEGNFVILA